MSVLLAFFCPLAGATHLASGLLIHGLCVIDRNCGRRFHELPRAGTPRLAGLGAWSGPQLVSPYYQAGGTPQAPVRVGRGAGAFGSGSQLASEVTAIPSEPMQFPSEPSGSAGSVTRTHYLGDGVVLCFPPVHARGSRTPRRQALALVFHRSLGAAPNNPPTSSPIDMGLRWRAHMFLIGGEGTTLCLSCGLSMQRAGAARWQAKACRNAPWVKRRAPAAR